LNDSEADEMSNNEFKRTLIKMIDDSTEDVYKYLNEFREDTNRQLNEPKENQTPE
jgi:hypothetical protein